VATPLFAVLVVVETTDVIFAVDSIPAIFAVTSEPFLVFTSNAFAILGLRALYFLLEGMIHRFTYLKLGLSAVLVFVGAKMLLSDLYKVSTWASLGVIATIIGISVWASLRRKDDRAVAEDPTGAVGATLSPRTREDGHAQTPDTT
jgi:tellurite resistance protein TerC